MKLEDVLTTWRKILEISEKPEPDEYKLLIKITFGGILLVGVIGYLIHLALTYAQGVGFG
ncbi:MAG: protein translocase SEC61 complex subunit gamma [Desulfurococcales archaeon]|nr:protein translocase SEC61 complex subunit gamma [Desulfurococcales archaeon]